MARDSRLMEGETSFHTSNASNVGLSAITRVTVPD